MFAKLNKCCKVYRYFFSGGGGGGGGGKTGNIPDLTDSSSESDPVDSSILILWSAINIISVQYPYKYICSKILQVVECLGYHKAGLSQKD